MTADGTRTVAVTGPITVAGLAEHLDLPERDVPVGLGGEPVTMLVDELVRRGERVMVVSLDRGVTDAVTLSGPRLDVHLGPYRPHGRARDAFRAERRFIARTLRRRGPDLVHAHWTYEFALGALAAGLPTVVTSHDWAPTALRLHPHPYRAVRLGMQAVVLRRARHLSAVSPSLEATMRPWTRHPISVVPNGLEDDRFARGRRELDRDGPIVAAVNHGFDRRKNVGALLRAFPDVLAHVPGCRLLLAGNGFEELGAAHRWARAHDLDRGVEFLGQRPRTGIDELMRQAAVLAHPSLWEACPMVLLEAMAQGVPVVGGATTPGVSWVLEDDAGVLTDVRSPAAIAAAILPLVTDGDDWAEASRRARERAWHRFRLTEVVDRYLALYDRAVVAGAP